MFPFPSPQCAIPERDPFYNSVTLLLHGDGANGATNNTFVDSSSSAFTMALAGGVLQGSPSPNSGGSASFDGTGSLSTGNNVTHSFGTADFTVEAWAFANSYPTADNALVSRWNSAGVGGVNQWMLDVQNTGVPKFYGSTSGINTDFFAVGPAITTGTWNHIAAVRQSGVLTIYTNGVAGTPVAAAGSLFATDGQPLRVGAYGSGGNWNGKIADLRIVNGTAVYTANFTPPSLPLTAVTNTKLLLNFNVGVVDSRRRNYLSTVSGAAITTAQKKFGTGSIALNGTTDYVTSPASSDWTFGTSPFTLECWAYFTSVAGTQTMVTNIISNSPDNAFRFGMNAATINFWTWNIGLVTGVIPITANQWHHLAATYDGANYRLFVDGVLDATAAGAQNLNGVNPLTIGHSGFTPAFLMSGDIEEVRITKGVCRYTASFAPPTSPFPNSN